MKDKLFEFDLDKPKDIMNDLKASDLNTRYGEGEILIDTTKAKIKKITRI
tara:strand:+ start:325 stop:474 length:150 start_codon:yes stop_codon:yes gene_type:complete